MEIDAGPRLDPDTTKIEPCAIPAFGSPGCIQLAAFTTDEMVGSGWVVCPLIVKPCCGQNEVTSPEPVADTKTSILVAEENVAESAGGVWKGGKFAVGKTIFCVVPLQLVGGKPVKLPFKHSDNEPPTLPAPPPTP